MEVNNMKYIIFIFCSLLICSCAEYETIGKYRYKVVTNNVNSGEFQGLIFKSNVFINQNNDTVFSKLLKAQKLYFEKKSDSVFAFGRLVVTRKNEKVFIITKEININGYEKFTECDSIVRIYEQLENGKVKLNRIVRYWDNQIRYKQDF